MWLDVVGKGNRRTRGRKDSQGPVYEGLCKAVHGILRVKGSH